VDRAGLDRLFLAREPAERVERDLVRARDAPRARVEAARERERDPAERAERVRRLRADALGDRRAREPPFFADLDRRPLSFRGDIASSLFSE
jgi:hypothetical protein